MNKPLVLRVMSSSDLAFADSLRALAGWNQTFTDWQRLLRYEPDGCFVAEWDGARVGSATTTSYGSDLAWIGMVLVHPQYRRRGIGKALLQHCLNYLKSREIRCVKLDATPLGKPLYEQLGFHEEWPLTRWQIGSPVASSPAAIQAEQGRGDDLDGRHSFSAAELDSRSLLEEVGSTPVLRLWEDSDAALAGPFDKKVFGVSRERMLASMAAESSRSLIYTTRAGQIGGYGMLREGTRASYLGPIVADSAHAGLALIRALLSGAAHPAVFWDVPDANTAARSIAEELGFTVQRPLLRMFLGSNENPGDPSHYFALADPAIG